MNRAIDSIASLMFFLICGLIALSIIAMSLPRTRHLSRASQCRVNLWKLSLGLHNYHSAYKQMPMAAGGSTGHKGYVSQLSKEHDSNRGRLSGFAALLPFVDQQAAWDKLRNRMLPDFPRMGPAPSYDPNQYKLWAMQFDVFLCPSDPAKKGDYGLRSYTMNYGDTVDSVGRLFDDSHEDQLLQKIVARGTFSPHKFLKFRDCVDGLSNTIVFSETMIGVGTDDSGALIARGIDGLVQQPGKALTIATSSKKPYKSGQAVWSVGKGSRWPEGCFVLNGFTTVLPPGGPSATLLHDPESGCVSASSYHSDGVHVVMGNGSIRFVSNSIDVGDPKAPSVSPLTEIVKGESPYGVWGAMGTRAGVEIIPSEREADFKTYTRF